MANTYSHVSDLRRVSQVVVVQLNTPPAAPQSDNIFLFDVESSLHLNTKSCYPDFMEAVFDTHIPCQFQLLELLPL